jgi:hypothetical protein
MLFFAKESGAVLLFSAYVRASRSSLRLLTEFSAE